MSRQNSPKKMRNQLQRRARPRVEFCGPARQGFELVERFEGEFARRIGAKHCVAVNSGYSALFLALWALGIRQGDEVIVPDFTMVATANAVLACGAKPVFVDVEYETGNISAELIEPKITKNTKAVIVVHIYGHPCDMDDISRLVKSQNLKLIEDAAEAHGAEYKGRKVGTLGDAGCFSFYANKIVSTGEGGAVTTADASLAEKIRKLRSYCFYQGYLHSGIGWSFRMNPYGAKEGLKQLLTFDKLVNKRREIARFYNENLTEKVGKPVEGNYAKNVYWMYGIRTNFRHELEWHLKRRGIETREFFAPMTMQPFLHQDEHLEESYKLWLEGLLLPSMPGLTKKQLKYICQSVNSFFNT